MHVPIGSSRGASTAWAMADLMALVLLDDRAPLGREGEERALRLTRRQRDVLYELVERGASNAEIGERPRPQRPYRSRST